jgi:trk system potassium uptake protein TrkH
MIEVLDMKRRKIHPYLIIIFSFLCIIAAGTLFLAMPFATKKGGPWGGSIGFIDALFMSTSATCVTGLSVVDLGTEFTIYGKVVMAVLMEIGGLSIITIAVFFFTMIGAKIGVSNRFLLRESLNQSSASGLITLVRKIILTSMSVQLICAGINMISLLHYYSTWYDALAVSLFHSAAAFNNAAPSTISVNAENKASTNTGTN